MFRQTLKLSAFICTSLLCVLSDLGHAQAIRKATDIVNQVRYLKVRGDPMGFRVPVNSVILSGAHHWQGVVRHPDPSHPYFYAVSSRAGCTELHVVRMGTSDSKSGYRIRSNRLDPGTTAIATAPPAADRVVNTIALADTHAGGMQAAGKYLAIPLGNHENCVPASDVYESQPRIAIYDISNPHTPVLARMLHDEDDVDYYPADTTPPNTSDAYNSIPGGLAELAFVQRDNGSYFLLGAFGSNLWHWSLSEDLSTFDQHGGVVAAANEWPTGVAFQSYQLINPLNEEMTDGSEILYLIGLRNTTHGGIATDEAWLYRLVLATPDRANDNRTTNFGEITIASISLVLKTDLTSRTAPDSPQINGNFSAGGSAWVSPTGGLLLYSCEHYISGLNYSVTMSEFCDRSGDSPASVPTDGCTAQVFLYTDTDFDGKVLTVDALDLAKKNFSNLFSNHEGAFGFHDNVSSVTWRLPAGCTARLYSQMNQEGPYLELSGAGSIADLDGVPWTSTGGGNVNNLISSVAFVGNTTPAPSFILSPGPAMTLNFYIFPGPCAMLKLNEGNYPGPALLTNRGQISSTGGLVRIGAQ